MSVADWVMEDISNRYGMIREHLNERQRRLWAGTEAKSIGHGGIRATARATGMSVNTVRAGLLELERPEEHLQPSALQRQRRAGAGRPSASASKPGLLEALDALVEPVTRGEPTCALRWTSKSTTRLAKELTAQGFEVSADTVARLLQAQGYSLQSTRKRFEGKQHPDRDAQFQYIANTSEAHLAQGQPAISVDTKSKELVGNFKAKGQEWQPQGQPVEVEAYDFPSQAEGKAAPYGVYDVLNNEGWVSVGISAATAEFAVHSLEMWWQHMGQKRFEHADHLLITADSGGANSARARLWKLQLQHFANTTGLTLTVLHFPPGTSKWNKIEHRMFNHITMNWRGRPLTSFEVVVECIAATTTSTGLRIEAALDENTYQQGIKVSDKQMKQINIHKHDFHGEWNYTIRPHK